MRAAATRPPVAGAWRPRQASPRGQVLDSGGAGRESRPGPVVHRCHRDRASESFREGRRQARTRARRQPLGSVRERRLAEDVRPRSNTTAPPSPLGALARIPSRSAWTLSVRFSREPAFNGTTLPQQKGTVHDQPLLPRPSAARAGTRTRMTCAAILPPLESAPP
jgi:hypothetical protein